MRVDQRVTFCSRSDRIPEWRAEDAVLVWIGIEYLESNVELTLLRWSSDLRGNLLRYKPTQTEYGQHG